MIWTPAEIRKSLGERAKKFGLKMPQMQTLLSQERFLARLCQLDEGQSYVWKGGSLVLRLYQHLEVPRFTVDIDLLARGIDITKTEEIFRRVMQIDLEDGFRFINITRTEMERETPYGGDRFEITWELFDYEQSESLKIDVCAGDDVDPQPISSKDVFLLPENERLMLAIYPAEFIFAEKLETADRFFTGNTRLKDFIDLWGLLKHPMEREKLKHAIQRCFQRRDRELKLERYQQLFTDPNFTELMEQARRRNFVGLPIPPIEKMFADLSSFISGLL